MNVEILNKPTNTACKIIIDGNDAITAEAGSMIAMDDHISVETTTHKKGKGSILSSIKRLFAGESFFLNHYTSPNTAGELWLSNGIPGDMIALPMTGGKIICQSGSFVACDNEIDINVGWQGFKNLLSGESLFWLEFSGTEGQVVLSSFGSIYEVDVKGDYVVDTSHIVAFEESLNFSLSKAGSSYFKSFLGGEGITCHFKGHGKVWCQSHNQKAFGKSLRPHLRVKKR